MANYYLKIEGIQGDVTIAGFEKQIEVQAWGWGLSRPAGGPTERERDLSRPSFQDFVFTLPTSAAIPPLFLAGAGGKELSQAELSAVKTDGGKQEKFLTIKFDNIVVTGFKQETKPGSDRPTVDVSINFTKIQVEYQPGLAGTTGPAKSEWDLRTNKGG